MIKRLILSVSWLNLLFLSEYSRSMSVTLLSFFSAIFLYKESMRLMANHELALMTVFVFFLILEITRFLGDSLAEDWARQWGLKKVVYLGIALTGLSIITFMLEGINFNFLWVAAVLWGFSVGFFWFGREAFIPKVGERKSYGLALGSGGMINSFIFAAVPILGAFVIKYFDYQGLFVVSLVFILLSFIPVIPLPQERTHRDVKLKEIFHLFSTHKKMFLAYFGTGASWSLYSTAFVLYVYLVLQKELSVGWFFSLSMLLVAFASVLIGKRCDHQGRKPLLIYGSVFSAVAWIGRMITVGTGGLFFLDIFDRIAGGMVAIPMEILTYEKAIDGHSTGRAVLFRDLSLSLGSMAILVLLILFTLFHVSFKVAFAVGMLGALAPVLIANHCGDTHES